MATQKKSNPKAVLPDEIVFEILLRLSVKTLLRCMAVCKSWLSLISSSNFVKTHLSISTNDPRSTHHHLLQPRNQYFESYSVFSLLNEPITEAIKIDNPVIKIDDTEFAGVVVGSCNGLVCFKTFLLKHVYLWNPSTRKIKRLPELKTKRVFTVFGLGYDESSNDFKLFAIVGDRPYKQEVSVYSSKSNRWKRIGVFPFKLAWNNGRFVDGALHWIVTKQNMRGRTIVSLDVKQETFREIDFPTNYGELDYFCMTLVTFGKNLALFNCEKFDFWVLKKCDVKESWTKVFTIPGDGLPIDPLNLKPLCICVNGNILLRLNSSLRLYNSKDNALEVLLHENYKAYYVYTYVESLVSP